MTAKRRLIPDLKVLAFGMAVSILICSVASLKMISGLVDLAHNLLAGMETLPLTEEEIHVLIGQSSLVATVSIFMAGAVSLVLIWFAAQGRPFARTLNFLSMASILIVSLPPLFSSQPTIWMWINFISTTAGTIMAFMYYLNPWKQHFIFSKGPR